MTVLLPAVIELLLLEFATGVDTGVLAVLPVLWILVGVILQPVVEEIVFRGWLLGYFLKVADGCTQRGRQALTIGGLGVSSVVFMFYHLRGFEVMLLAGGLVFGLLFLGFRRNIVPAAVAHMAANLLVLLAAHGLLPVGYLLALFV